MQKQQQHSVIITIIIDVVPALEGIIIMGQ
jgi:hypothetical protein